MVYVRMLLKQITEFGKFVGFKIKMQKTTIVFVYDRNDQKQKF